ncbi:MAG: DUF882 domain-containing protein [Deltaproteobacteria bacterium]|nr:DUF882 domain-containing protein [Deltaproteobacteria bacterium]
MRLKVRIIVLSPGRSARQYDIFPLLSPLIIFMAIAPLFGGVALNRCYGYLINIQVAKADFTPVTNEARESEDKVRSSAATRDAASLQIPDRWQAFSIEDYNGFKPAKEIFNRDSGLTLSEEEADFGRASEGYPEAFVPVSNSISARVVKYGYRTMGRIRQLFDFDKSSELANGMLRIHSLHTGETLKARLLDSNGVVDSTVLSELSHLMRCRRTTDEVSIDPKLAQILVQISAAYNRSVYLVSGHRSADAVGTNPTSQHVLGRAADIKVPGVPISALQQLAIKLGARGIGLYPEKQFIHVDVRKSPKYFWIYSRYGTEIPLPIRPGT